MAVEMVRGERVSASDAGGVEGDSAGCGSTLDDISTVATAATVPTAATAATDAADAASALPRSAGGDTLR